MKRFKILLTLLFMVAIAAGILAFKTTQKVEIVTYYFYGYNKHISTIGTSSLSQTEITDFMYWTTIPPLYLSGNGEFLAGIKFDEENINLSSALYAVWDHYSFWLTLPEHDSILYAWGTDITILRRYNNFY